MTFKTLIFDLDDTIFDFQKTEHRSLEVIFNSYNIPFEPQYIERYKKINLGLWHDLEHQKIERETLLNTRFSLFLESCGQVVDGALVERQYRALLNEGYDLLPHAHEVLGALKRQGYVLLAATNGTKVTQENRLKVTQIGQYFDDIFISEDLGVEKPHRAFFETIFQKHSLTNMNEILMIGDSVRADIFGASQFGIKTAWMNHLGRENTNPIHDYELTCLSELAHILQ